MLAHGQGTPNQPEGYIYPGQHQESIEKAKKLKYTWSRKIVFWEGGKGGGGVFHTEG